MIAALRSVHWNKSGFLVLPNMLYLYTDLNGGLGKNDKLHNRARKRRRSFACVITELILNDSKVT